MNAADKTPHGPSTGVGHGAGRARAQAGWQPELGDRKFVVALARGLEVLRAFTPTVGQLSNQEIAARAQLPRPTVSRLTYTLMRLGYLTQVEHGGKYQLAPAALSIGYAALAQMGIRQIARPLMQELAEYAGASVALGSRDRMSAVYVEHCRSNSPVTLRLDIGSRIPLVATAMGRAIIAVLPEAERLEIFARAAARDPERWPRIRDSVERAIAHYRRFGYTASVGDWEDGVNAVGVPLVASDGSGVFAFNCGAPSFLISPDRLDSDIGPRLVELVHRVESVLNGRR
jgi:DNA-binding IclR family transcriptional regulator